MDHRAILWCSQLQAVLAGAIDTAVATSYDATAAQKAQQGQSKKPSMDMYSVDDGPGDGTGGDFAQGGALRAAAVRQALSGISSRGGAPEHRDDEESGALMAALDVQRALARARSFLRSLVTVQLPKLVAMWVCVSMLMLTFTFAGSIFRMKISRCAERRALANPRQSTSLTRALPLSPSTLSKRLHVQYVLDFED